MVGEFWEVGELIMWWWRMGRGGWGEEDEGRGEFRRIRIRLWAAVVMWGEG